MCQEKIAQIDAEIAKMTPDQAMKIAKATMNYGRVEVVISRTELQKLFSKHIGIITAEYNVRSEELSIIIEGDGLPPYWREGYNPMRVLGTLLGGSYCMLKIAYTTR